MNLSLSILAWFKSIQFPSKLHFPCKSKLTIPHLLLDFVIQLIMFTDLNIYFIFLSLANSTYSPHLAATLSSPLILNFSNLSLLLYLKLHSYHLPYFTLFSINFLDLHFQALFVVSQSDIYLSHFTPQLSYSMLHWVEHWK